MDFRSFIESNDHEEALRRLVSMVQDVYGQPIHPQALDYWRSKTTEEILQQIQHLDTEERRKVAFNKRMEASQKEKEKQALFGDYFRVDGGHQRAVCSEGNPGYEKTGMPCTEDMAKYDSRLKGYWGVHVGDSDEWLPILKRDGYCDDDAYVYDIDAEKGEFYEMEDPNVMDRTSAPSSWIIFSKMKVIPAAFIRFVKKVSHRKIRTAPDPT